VGNTLPASYKRTFLIFNPFRVEAVGWIFS